MDNYDRNIRNAAELHKHGVPLIQRDELKGHNAVICGSGPSLKRPEIITRIKQLASKGHLIIACKHAIRHLYDKGIKVDMAVSMDPGAHIARPDIKIYKAPGCRHILASVSDPLLFDYIMSNRPYGRWLKSLTKPQQKSILKDDYKEWRAKKLLFRNLKEDLPAKVAIFHSACGLAGEVDLYNELFGSEHEDCMGGGLNVVNRAVSLAMYMGIDKIVMAGADCGWREEDSFYCYGDNNVEGVNMKDHGQIDGKEWVTRPDMVASAVDLVRHAHENPGRFEHLGDTLPAALMDKDDDFLTQVASFIKH